MLTCSLNLQKESWMFYQIYSYRFCAAPFVLFLSLSCTFGSSFDRLFATTTEKKSASPQSQKNNLLKAITFNVENLFDEKDDPDRKDQTYLPKEEKRSKKHKDDCHKIQSKRWRHECLHWDWDEDFVSQKLGRIAEVIKSSFEGGPDLIFLQEVENKRVLDLLVDGHLKELGYTQAHLLEGRDPRGIDVAIIHKGQDLKKPFQRDFKIPRKKRKQSLHSRPFLVSSFSLNGKKIAAISVHLPSPRHPTIQRVEGITALTDLGDELARDHDLVIAAGDFNVNATEDSSLYRKLAGENWLVSHHEACERCLGTNYYKRKKSWSFLDAILIHKKSKTAGFNNESTKIIKDLWFQQTSAGRPARMHLRGNKLDGISDHFPLATEIEIL